MASGAATDCTARVFAQELGIAGEAFEALKAPDIEIEDGVPKALKKNWHKWCLRGHPDKGGDSDAFIAMETRYSAFKDWFQAQRDAPASRAKERSQQRGQAKEDGDKALGGGRKALEGKQYEDAKVFAEEAIKAYEAYKSLQLRRDDDAAQKMVLEATKLKEEAEEQIRVRELEKRQRDADKAQIVALTAENERLNINCKEWQQKLKESEERSSASMRELQDKCKSLEEESLDKCKSSENIIQNLERKMQEMKEGLEEGLEEQEAGLEKKASAAPAWIPTSVSQFFGLSTSSVAVGSKKGDRSVKDYVKSAIKNKTQGLQDELAKVKAELAASQKKVDELKTCMQDQQNICDAREAAQKLLKDELAKVKAELAASQKKVDELKTCMQEQQNICDAREAAQKDVLAQLTAKDADLACQHANVQSLEANVQRLDAELATNKAKAAALDNICNALESELKEIKSGLARQGLDKSLQTAVSSEDASIITNDIVDAQNAAASTCNDPHAGNIAQECELTDIRVKLSAQEELFEVYERDLKSSEQTLEKTYQAKMQLEQLEDADVQDTVDRAEQARREHSEAKKNFDAVDAKREMIKEERESLKAKLKEKLFEVTELNHSFLRGLK